MLVLTINNLGISKFKKVLDTMFSCFENRIDLKILDYKNIIIVQLKCENEEKTEFEEYEIIISKEETVSNAIEKVCNLEEYDVL